VTNAHNPETIRNFDPDRIIACLRANNVSYIIVGGVAGRIYGASRTTSDLDLVPADDPANLDRLARALRDLGARLRVSGLSPTELESLTVPLDGRTLRHFGVSTWMTDVGPVDVLLSMRTAAGAFRTFHELVVTAITANTLGGPVRLASLEDIVASKEFANRPKDREALPELRRLLLSDQRDDR